MSPRPDDPLVLTLARGAVTQEIRPDWDLSAPGLREAWEAGDAAPFHGWSRRGLPGAAPAV